MHCMTSDPVGLAPGRYVVFHKAKNVINVKRGHYSARTKWQTDKVLHIESTEGVRKINVLSITMVDYKQDRHGNHDSAKASQKHLESTLMEPQRMDDIRLRSISGSHLRTTCCTYCAATPQQLSDDRVRVHGSNNWTHLKTARQQTRPRHPQVNMTQTTWLWPSLQLLRSSTGCTRTSPIHEPLEMEHSSGM